MWKRGSKQGIPSGVKRLAQDSVGNVMPGPYDSPTENLPRDEQESLDLYHLALLRRIRQGEPVPEERSYTLADLKALADGLPRPSYQRS